MKPPPPISWRSSFARGSHFGISPRSARNGRSSGYQTPPSSRLEPASPAERRASQLAHVPDLAELLLDVVEADDADRVGDQVSQAEGEAELHVGAREGLMHDVAAPARVGDHLGVADRVAVEEDALLRHLDVVEDDDAVHLVEARQRVVERRRCFE